MIRTSQILFLQRLNALGGSDGKQGNLRTAIAAESNRKVIDPNKLPKIEKNPKETELIMEALCGNTFMKNLARDQLQKVIFANL